MTGEEKKDKVTDQRKVNIQFGDNAAVHGDVVGGDKISNTSVEASGDGISKEDFLLLLSELRNCIKEAPIDEDEKDIASGKIATAISEVKNNEVENTFHDKEKKDKIGVYLKETKTILDRVKDVGEIGGKALPIILKLGKMIGLALL